MPDQDDRPAPLRPGGPGGPARWQPLDLTAVIERLEEAKALLQQAAAVAAAQDDERIGPLVELQRRLAEEQRGDANRRRYR